jgi:hypothetical protein
MASRVNTGVGSAVGGSGALALSAFAATAGNAIVVVVRNGASGSSPTSVTDTAGNTYTLCVSPAGPDPNMWVYVALNITGHAANVVSVNFAGTRDFSWGFALQYSGVKTAAAVDASGTSRSDGTTDLATSAITTAQADEVIVVAASQAAFRSYTAGAGFSLIDGAIGSGPYGGIEDQILSATWSGISAHMTSSGGATATLVWVTLKAATAKGLFWYDRYAAGVLNV